MRLARPGLSVFLAALVWTSAGRVAAQELADVTRSCTPADLPGAWEVIRFGSVPSVRVDRSDPAFYPYQRYVFGKDATVRQLGSPTKITAADHRALLAAAAAGTWAVDEGGRLLLLPEGKARLERITCLVLVEEVVDPKNRVRSLPGDILLTYYDAAEKPAFRRQLRKLDGVGE